jgi:hypothetical protein
MSTTYIISNLEQLVYIPMNDLNLTIELETLRYVKNYDNATFKVLHIKLYNSYLVSMPYELLDYSGTDIPYIYNTKEIIDTLNKYGFDVVYQNHIELNENEISILTSVNNLGYNYIQFGTPKDIDIINIPNLYIYVSEQPLNSYDSNENFVSLLDLTNKVTVDDFVWIKEYPLTALSISLLLQEGYPEA